MADKNAQQLGPTEMTNGISWWQEQTDGQPTGDCNIMHILKRSRDDEQR